jgi:hypothetical protein
MFSSVISTATAIYSLFNTLFWPTFLILKNERFMTSPCCLCVFFPTSFYVVFVAAGTCLPSCCLAETGSFDSTNPALRRHFELHSKFSGLGVFCAARIIYIHYVMKGKYAISSSQKSLLCPVFSSQEFESVTPELTGLGMSNWTGRTLLHGFESASEL